MSSILAGVSRHPSTTSVTGSSRAADSNVMMLNKLKLSSCTGCSPSTGGALAMSFLENTLRDWKVRLEPMADKKPRQLKVACMFDGHERLREGIAGLVGEVGVPGEQATA
eukprot:1157855-Pelagomonas_calceolata.AAC.3